MLARTSSRARSCSRYRTGLFPMRLGLGGPVGVVVARSARRDPARRAATSPGRSAGRSAASSCASTPSFEAVMRACADPKRPHGWIDESFVAAYCELHRLGWAHSIETWHDGELVGGLYGVAIGGLFAGESMFHRATRRLEGRAREHGRAARCGWRGSSSTCSGSRPTSSRSGAVAMPRAEYAAPAGGGPRATGADLARAAPRVPVGWRAVALSPEEARVLGCLLEKERTTPDAYPLSLNALVVRVQPVDEPIAGRALQRDDRRDRAGRAAGAELRAARRVPRQPGDQVPPRARRGAGRSVRPSSRCSACSCSAARRPPAS